MADTNAAPVGNGMTKVSMNTIQAKKDYQSYAMDAQSNGEQPIPFEDWLAQIQAADAANRNQQKEGYDSATK